MCVFVWQTRKPRQRTKWVQSVLTAAAPACSAGCLCRTSRSKWRCCAACSTWGSREHSCRPASGSRDAPVVATTPSPTTGLENQFFPTKMSDASQFLGKRREGKHVSCFILRIDQLQWTVGKKKPSHSRLNIFVLFLILDIPYFPSNTCLQPVSVPSFTFVACSAIQSPFFKTWGHNWASAWAGSPYFFFTDGVRLQLCYLEIIKIIRFIKKETDLRGETTLTVVEV